MQLDCSTEDIWWSCTIWICQGFFENASFQSKCGFCSPYQLGPLLEANTLLLIENITMVRNQVWGSLSSLLGLVAFFVDSSKVWSTTAKGHLWTHINVILFLLFFSIWVGLGNYHSRRLFLHFSSIFGFLLEYRWNDLANNEATSYQLLYETSK